jgi:hypothetical protein
VLMSIVPQLTNRPEPSRPETDNLEGAYSQSSN